MVMWMLCRSSMLMEDVLIERLGRPLDLPGEWACL